MSTTLPLTSERAIDAPGPLGALEIIDVSRTYTTRGAGRRTERPPAAPSSRRSGRGDQRHGERRRAREALRGVSLTIQRGSFVALLGPNGSGKSTLLRILSTADQPDAGTFCFGSLSPLASTENARAFRARIGVVFQSPGLDPLLTVRENLSLAAVLAGVPSGEITDRVTSLAREFEITDRLDERVRTLSGGLARRVDLCRAMLGRPSLLLLDEATTGLDHRARLGFFDAIERTRAAIGPTILLATHLMDEAERAERVVMMHEGRVVADGTPDLLRAGVGARSVRVRAETPDLIARAISILARKSVSEVARPGMQTAVSSDRLAGNVVAPLPDDPSHRQELLEQLASGGFSFEVGSPTLGDAYLKATGTALDADGLPDGGLSG